MEGFEDDYEGELDARDDIMAVQPYPPWRAAVEAFLSAGFQPGDVIEHEWFWKAFGLKRPPDDTPLGVAQREMWKFLKQFEPFCTALLCEHKILLVNERSVGYRFVPAGEQTQEAYEEGVREVRKAIRKMGLRITHIDLTALTDQQRRQNAEALAKLSMLETMRRKVRRLPGPDTDD